MEIETEKTKMEDILNELLPKTVAARLVTGIQVEPEAFYSCTLFFSDIVGFTSIASMATPMQIVIMLNDMYTLFDDVTQKFDFRLQGCNYR